MAAKPNSKKGEDAGALVSTCRLAISRTERRRSRIRKGNEVITAADSEMTMGDSTAKKNVWCLTDRSINDLQVLSIDRLIKRCGAAHHVNVQIRINGQDEIHEADWLKHLKRVVELADQSQLMSFYDVRTKDELIDRLYHHIERLQERAPPTRDESQRTPREG
jgi:hypothetical protein